MNEGGIDGWLGEWLGGCMDGWMVVWVGECMDE